MIRLFCGFDQRESAGAHAFIQSVIEKTTIPVSIIPLRANNQRDGSNRFTYSRFTIPYLCDFQGWALWLDGADMILNADLAELWTQRPQWGCAVQVVKHDYKPAHARKYIGTEMEAENRDYKRKNWSSVIVWDCGHFGNRCLTPEFLANHDGAFLHRFGWLAEDRIGELPLEWNWLDEYGVNTEAKIIHYTNGIPSIPAYRNAPHAQLWQLYSAKTMQSPAERIAEIASAR